jgi:hypothetical protein
MAQGNSRDPQREQTWRRHLRRQRASGLTVRDYCVRHQLRETAFYFWRREIAARDDERHATSAADISATHPEPAFVPVTLVESLPRADSSIDIRLRSGHRLRVRAGCDRQLLSEVVALLEGRPC